MLCGDTTNLGPCPSRSWGHQPRHIGAIGWHYNIWSHVLIEMQQSFMVVKDLWLDAQGRTSPPCMSRCSSSSWLTQTGWTGEDLTYLHVEMQQSFMVEPYLWLDGQGRNSSPWSSPSWLTQTSDWMNRGGPHLHACWMTGLSEGRYMINTIDLSRVTMTWLWLLNIVVIWGYNDDDWVCPRLCDLLYIYIYIFYF